MVKCVKYIFCNNDSLFFFQYRRECLIIFSFVKPQLRSKYPIWFSWPGLIIIQVTPPSPAPNKERRSRGLDAPPPSPCSRESPREVGPGEPFGAGSSAPYRGDHSVYLSLVFHNLYRGDYKPHGDVMRRNRIEVKRIWVPSRFCIWAQPAVCDGLRTRSCKTPPPATWLRYNWQQLHVFKGFTVMVVVHVPCEVITPPHVNERIYHPTQSLLFSVWWEHLGSMLLANFKVTVEYY